MADESTNAEVFGFTASTAAALLADLRQSGNTQRPPVQQNVFATHICVGVTAAPITGGTTGTVNVYGPGGGGWTSTGETIEAWAWPTSIGSGLEVLCVPVNGRWLALEIC